MKKKQIAILGAGNIGIYIGAQLQASGLDVLFIGRPNRKAEADGFGFTASDLFGRTVKTNNPVNFLTQWPTNYRPDYILLAVKSGATAELIARYGSQWTGIKLLSLQNGIENSRMLREALGAESVVRTVVPFNVISRGQGVYYQATEGHLSIENNQAGRDFAQAVAGSSLKVQLHKDIHGLMWGKLIMNLNNAVNALCGRPIVEELRDKRYRQILAAAIAEALQLLKKKGIVARRSGKVKPNWLPFLLGIPNALFERAAAGMLKMDPSARSSMWDDFQVGRLTEVDFLNGEIVRLAESMGLDAPVNGAFCRLIREVEAKGQGSPNLGPVELKKRLIELGAGSALG